MLNENFNWNNKEEYKKNEKVLLEKKRNESNGNHKTCEARVYGTSSVRKKSRRN